MMEQQPLFGPSRPQVVIDVANLAYRAYYAHHNLTTSRGEPSGHIYGVVQSLIRLHKQFNPVEWIYAYEGTAEHRRRVLPQYKGQRKERTFTPLPGVEALLQALPGLHLRHPEWEADDVLAMVTREPFRKGPMILVTTDQDLWAFVGHPHVRVYAKDRFVDPIDLATKYGLSSGRRVPLYKAIFGDPSDNIPPAVLRLPKKPILEIIEGHACSNPHDFLKVLEKVQGNKAARKLLDAQDTLWRNWEVSRLRVDTSGLRYKRGPTTPDLVVSLLKHYECTSLIPKAKEMWNA